MASVSHSNFKICNCFFQSTLNVYPVTSFYHTGMSIKWKMSIAIERMHSYFASVRVHVSSLKQRMSNKVCLYTYHSWPVFMTSDYKLTYLSKICDPVYTLILAELICVDPNIVLDFYTTYNISLCWQLQCLRWRSTQDEVLSLCPSSLGTGSEFIAQIPRVYLAL